MRVALVLCSLLLSSSILAQDFELTSVNLTVQNGLAGDNVYCALQDDKGYIWFGTETGVSRYNGRSFENFYMSDGLADNEIFRIDQDSQGRIWFSAFNGQMSYYYQGQFFNKSNSDLLAAIEFDDFYTNLFEDSRGNLWLNTKTRIVMIGVDGIVKNLEDLGGVDEWRVASFMEKDGVVWAGSGYDKKIYHLPADRTTERDSVLIGEGFADFIAPHLAFLPSSQSSFPNRYVNSFLDQKKEISRTVTKTHTYPNGELWACTFSGGVKIDKTTGKKTTFLESKQVSHVLRDREGGYWFTTFGDGVYFVPSLEKSAISTIDDQPVGNTTALYMQDDVLWFGANSAVIGKISTETSKKWNLSLNGGRSRVKKIVRMDNTSGLLLAVEEAIVFKDEKDNFSRLEGAVKIVQPWTDSLIVVGTTNQVIVFDREVMMNWFRDEGNDNKPFIINFRNQPAVTRFASNGSVTDMAIYQEGMLISTALGLYFLDQDLNYKKLSGHPVMSNVINDIKVLNDSSYLLATNGFGTFLYRDDIWTNFSTQNGMSSEINRKVFAKNDSVFWVATNAGVNRVTGGEGNWEVSSIKSTDGLLSEDVNDLLIHGDNLIAATSKGISWINIPDWESAKIPPLVSMNALLVDDLPWMEEKHEINHGVKNITVNYDGLHFQSLDRLVYRYRLSGLDETWRTTRQNTLNFSNLKPGEYTFQVRAVSAFGDESELAGIQFVIATPFWMTWWFIGLISLLGLLALIVITNAIIRRNKQKQQRKYEFQLRIAEAERKALQSQLNPHFIFNSLNSIQNMVLDEDPDSAYQYLAKFGKLIRRVLEFSDISMVPLTDELETLRLYMDLENLRLNDKFDYRIHIGEGVNLLEVIPGMIIQPHVENAIWHGIMPLKGKKRGYIDITIRKISEGLQLEVLDNGVGRKPMEEGTQKSMGTKIVNELVRKHKGEGSGEVIVEDLFDGNKPSGTKVIIQILSEHIAYD
ncbi:MAG: histidine kinase [Roseivirga sp.]|nr:histidine kinase [Roseivirga sp.]